MGKVHSIKRAVRRNPERFYSVKCGNRFGKSLAAAMEVVAALSIIPEDSASIHGAKKDNSGEWRPAFWRRSYYHVVKKELQNMGPVGNADS